MIRPGKRYLVGKSWEEIEKEVLKNEKTLKYLEGNIPKKIIVVPEKIVNIVVKHKRLSRMETASLLFFC